MKPADVKSSTRMESSKEINNKDLKFRNGDIVRISNFGYIFAKGYVTNQSEEVFVLKKAKKSFLWTQVISDLKGNKIVGTFYVKELQKQIKKSLDLKRQ